MVAGPLSPVSLSASGLIVQLTYLLKLAHTEVDASTTWGVLTAFRAFGFRVSSFGAFGFEGPMPTETPLLSHRR